MLSVIPFPTAIPAKPFDVIMVPEFSTELPRSAAKPAFMLPWLITEAAVPVLINVYFSERKSLSFIPRVDATSPPAFIDAPGAKITPAGLIRKSCPLAESDPKISEGLLPRTRLSRVD